MAVGFAFPPPPHDLSNIMDWANGFTEATMLTGLAYKNLRVDRTTVEWAVFFENKCIGSIIPRAGTHIRAECQHGLLLLVAGKRRVRCCRTCKWDGSDADSHIIVPFLLRWAGQWMVPVPVQFPVSVPVPVPVPVPAALL